MKRILNVGCGEDTHGTDFIDVYKSRSDVIKCNINSEKFPYKSNTFNEVYSRCVFEHLTNPMQVLKEMKRVLKKNGKLIIITDNAGFWGFHLPRSNTHYGGYEKNAKSKDDKHYLLFTPWHLRNFYKTAGLRKIKTEYCFVDDSISSYLIRFIVKKISKTIYLLGLRKISYPQIKIIGKK